MAPEIIGFCNQKGGTGKTTTALNVAAFLALSGKKTLLVDMDPQGNATTGIGCEYKNNSKSVYEVLTNALRAEDVLLQTQIKNLFLIPSSLNLTGAEIELISEADREFKLRKTIEDIAASFEYVIIDAPPSLGILTVNILAAARWIIIPMQCEYFALEGLSNIVSVIKLIRSRINNNLDLMGILFTMADFRTRLTLQVITEVKRVFPDKVFNTVIPRNIKLAEAPSFGKPIYLYDAVCSGARAYFNLTEEILNEKIQGVYHGEEKCAR